MEYISECCHKKIDLNEQLKNVSAGFCENAIQCCNSMFMEKNDGSGLVRKKNVPQIGEVENILSYHRIEFARNEEFNLLYLPNEIYDLKEEDFNKIALIKCKFNKKVKEDIQNEILEVTVLKVTMLSDFIELYPLNYTGKAIESFEENNEYLTIDKFGKWKCYISNIEGNLENWQITYTDDQNVEHCLIRGFWCMSDEDIASMGNVIYSEEENNKFWEDVLASDGIKINDEKLYTDKSIFDSNRLNNETLSRVIMANMVNLKKILQEYNYDMDSIINFSIGYDDKIYILLKDGWKSQYCDIINGSNYSIIVLDVDWQNYIINNISHYKLGTHKKYFYHIQPIMDKILLVGSDDLKIEDENYTSDDIIPGGAIVDYSGNVLKEFSLGECINDCIVLDNGNIITSYGDEGIFGNVFAGGSSGLTVWNIEGNSIWDTNRDVSDCYAINIDSSNDLWYYYYTDFDLIHTDLKGENVYDPKIEYANGFLLNDTKDYIIFAKRNTEQHIYQFIIESFINENIENSKELYFEYNNENIKIKDLKFRKAKAVFIDEEDRMFLKWFR